MPKPMIIHPNQLRQAQHQARKRASILKETFYVEFDGEQGSRSIKIEAESREDALREGRKKKHPSEGMVVYSAAEWMQARARASWWDS